MRRQASHLATSLRGDGMKDLIEDLVADLPGAGQLDQRKRKPLAEDGQMSGAEQTQCHFAS